jgi:tetratricopeptide (TPR) repeat protein
MLTMFRITLSKQETMEPALRLTGDEAHLKISEELRAAFMRGGCWADHSLRKLMESIERRSLEDIERDAEELKGMYQEALGKQLKDKPWMNRRQHKLGRQFEGWLAFLQTFDKAKEEGITELGILDFQRILLSIPKHEQAAAIERMNIERAMYELDIEFPKQTIALIKKLRRGGIISQVKVTQDASQIAPANPEQSAAQEPTRSITGATRTRRWGPMKWLSWFRREWQDHLKCMRMIEEAVKAARENSDHGRYDLIQSLNDTAGEYQMRGMYSEAEPLFKRALRIREKELGPDHPDVAMSANNLAGLYNAQGRYDKSEPLYRRALAIWENAHEPDHLNVARGLHNLGGQYYDLGKYTEAEPMFKRALEIRESKLGQNHPDVGNVLNNLGCLYHDQGMTRDAEELLRRSLAIRRRSYGKYHPHVSQSSINLARVLTKLGKWREAEVLCKEAHGINKRLLGRNHPEMAQVLVCFANLYDAQGRYEKSERFHKRALSVFEKALGPDHPDVAMSQNNLALHYQVRGDLEAAEQLFERALEISRKALGPEHPGTKVVLKNLKALCEEIERTEEAERLSSRAHGIAS